MSEELYILLLANAATKKATAAQSRRNQMFLPSLVLIPVAPELIFKPFIPLCPNRLQAGGKDSHVARYLQHTRPPKLEGHSPPGGIPSSANLYQ